MPMQLVSLDVEDCLVDDVGICLLAEEDERFVLELVELLLDA